MKVIDKTNSNNKGNGDYGTVLKCWDDNYSGFDLLRIGNSGSTPDRFKLYIIHDRVNNESCHFACTYDSIASLYDGLETEYDHVLPVKAMITIEDL